MKNILRSRRVTAFITPDKTAYMVVGELDATEEEIEAAITAEEELEQWRQMKGWINDRVQVHKFGPVADLWEE